MISRDFHEGSHHIAVVRILAATEATVAACAGRPSSPAMAFAVRWKAPRQGCGQRSIQSLEQVHGSALDEIRAWLSAPTARHRRSLKPRAHYMRNTRLRASRAMTPALRTFVSLHGRVEELVDEAQEKRRKIICFVTGVPGAGKTLVGLNVATRRRDARRANSCGIPLRNGPLVGAAGSADP